MGSDYDEEFIRQQVRHEQQHAEAALALGATTIKYGVSFSQLESDDPKMNGRVCSQPFAWPELQTDKLGVALVASAPDELSAGDEANLRSLGYRV